MKNYSAPTIHRRQVHTLLASNGELSSKLANYLLLEIRRSAIGHIGQIKIAIPAVTDTPIAPRMTGQFAFSLGSGDLGVVSFSRLLKRYVETGSQLQIVTCPINSSVKSTLWNFAELKDRYPGCAWRVTPRLNACMIVTSTFGLFSSYSADEVKTKGLGDIGLLMTSDDLLHDLSMGFQGIWHDAVPGERYAG